MRSIWLVFGLCVFLISCATIEVSKEDFIEFSRKYEVNTMAYTQSVAFSPDDKYLATGGVDCRLFDVMNGQILKQFNVNTMAYTMSVVMTSNKYYLVTGGADCRLFFFSNSKNENE